MRKGAVEERVAAKPARCGRRAFFSGSDAQGKEVVIRKALELSRHWSDLNRTDSFNVRSGRQKERVQGCIPEATAMTEAQVRARGSVETKRSQDASGKAGTILLVSVTPRTWFPQGRSLPSTELNVHPVLVAAKQWCMS